MTKRKPRSVAPEFNDDDVPDWVKDDSPGRSTPYTEEELDLLVEGTLEGIRDTPAWKNLVRQVGEKEAHRTKLKKVINSPY